MNNVTISVEIKAPELVDAICALASALAIGKNSQNPNLQKPVEPLTTGSAPAVQPMVALEPAATPQPAPVQPAPVQPAPQNAPQQPIYQPVPQAPVSPQPVQSQQPVQQPMQQSVQPASVPVAPAPQYTFEQLGVAAGPLVDAGRGPELSAWLQSKGAQTLTQLDKSLYGEFAMFLRSLGAKI